MRVIITAGGTGGHIYPALAIANKIKEMNSKSEILYIGTHNRMEKDIVPAAGYKYEALEIYGLSKTEILRNIKNIYLIIKARKKSMEIIKEFKPDIVIGVGGYISYPVIMAAKKSNIKIFLHEQNSIPGKANKILSRYADVIGVSFEDSLKHFNHKKVILTGNPCSENALKIKATSKNKYDLNPKKKTVLFVQGSLGSEVINNKMVNFLSSIDNEAYEVLYIAGKNYYEKFIKNKFSKNVKVVPYVDNLSSVMKSVDLIITRAGASTISEITALGLPCIFIPSPYVANNHQYYNALSLKVAGAGLLIEQNELEAKILKEKINHLLNNYQVYQDMKKNLQKLCIKDSSTKIYNILKDLTEKRTV